MSAQMQPGPQSGPRLASEEERLARVALNSLGEPGDPRLARLVEAMGAQELCARLEDDVDLAGLRSDASERLSGLDPRRILDGARQRGIRFVVPGDAEWPSSFDDLARVEPLHGLAGPPLGVWARGPLSLAEATTNAVAIVGSRSATTYGTDVAATLASEVGSAGFTVVSGAAFGIDQAAHRGALAARAPTVAVLACGVDRHYPTNHRELLEHIAASARGRSWWRQPCAAAPSTPPPGPTACSGWSWASPEGCPARPRRACTSCSAAVPRPWSPAGDTCWRPCPPQATTSRTSHGSSRGPTTPSTSPPAASSTRSRSSTRPR